MPVPEWLLVRVAEQLRVLGHVVRLRLVEHLAEQPRTPQELAEMLGLTQQNASKHLQVLYTSGLVTRRREGARVLYGLSDSVILELLGEMAARVSLQLVELSKAAQLPAVADGA